MRQKRKDGPISISIGLRPVAHFKQTIMNFSVSAPIRPQPIDVCTSICMHASSSSRTNRRKNSQGYLRWTGYYVEQAYPLLVFCSGWTFVYTTKPQGSRRCWVAVGLNLRGMRYLTIYCLRRCSVFFSRHEKGERSALL